MCGIKSVMPSQKLLGNTLMKVCYYIRKASTLGSRPKIHALGQTWPELLGALFQASQSPDVGQREGAFRIFATTPGIIEKQHEETVQGAFAKGFRDEDVNVRWDCLYPDFD